MVGTAVVVLAVAVMATIRFYPEQHYTPEGRSRVEDRYFDPLVFNAQMKEIEENQSEPVIKDQIVGF